jgi:hypothetical protein
LLGSNGDDTFDVFRLLVCTLKNYLDNCSFFMSPSTKKKRYFLLTLSFYLLFGVTFGNGQIVTLRARVNIRTRNNIYIYIYIYILRCLCYVNIMYALINFFDRLTYKY